MNGQTSASEHRAAARELDRKAEESFERSDTDGFLSQWALGIGAQEHRLAADIAEAGGTWTFRGLFDRATGERVKAKIVKFDGYAGGTVSKWIVLDENDDAVHWLPAYKTSKRSKLYLLGLEERDETAPAIAATGGSGRGLSSLHTVHVYAKRTDGGYPAGAKTLSAIRKGGRS